MNIRDRESMGSPGLVIFALIVIAAMLIIVGTGVVPAAIVAASIAVLVSAGIISSLMVVGFKTGSASKGARLALFQICAVLCCVAGPGIAAIIKVFTHIALGWTPVEVLGLISGLSTGMVIGASLSTLLKYALQRWGPRMDKGFEVIQPPAIIQKIT